MSVGIAMALREQRLGARGVDNSIGILVEDALVRRITHLPGSDAASEIPWKPVIKRPQFDARKQKISARAEHRQLLLQERRELSTKCKKGCGDVTVGVVLGSNAYRGVRCVGPCLVAQDHVEVVQIS